MKIDIVPSTRWVLGFTNRWYAGLAADSRIVPLSEGRTIRIPNLPRFLATKLEAYADPRRAWSGDPRSSHDVEDVLAVLDGCRRIEDELRSAGHEVENFLRSGFAALLADPAFVEAVDGFARDAGRASRILGVMRRFAAATL